MVIMVRCSRGSRMNAEIERSMIVALPSPFKRDGGSIEEKNPRQSFEFCERINEKKGRSKLLHLHGCHHCMRLIDACHDAALLYELLLRLDPDSTIPTVETVTTAFEVVE